MVLESFRKKHLLGWKANQKGMGCIQVASLQRLPLENGRLFICVNKKPDKGLAFLFEHLPRIVLTSRLIRGFL